MNERLLNELIENKLKLSQRLNFYILKKLIVKQSIDKAEILGHFEKAKHNLEFVFDTSKEKYSDWVITGCYYAVYQAVLSLIMTKGYSSKNHDASLCILIKEYYEIVGKDNVKLINDLFIDYSDLIFYIHSKNQREDATYSTKLNFNDKVINNLILKTRLFVGKVDEILNNYQY